MPDEKFADQKLSEEELDGVAGGTREEFNEICRLLGKSPTWNTRDGIRKYLMKNYNIEVVHWNTGDRGSKKNAPAEFSITNKDTGVKLNGISFNAVKGVITGTMTFGDVYADYLENSTDVE